MARRAQQVIGTAKSLPVPEGTWAVGAGLAVAGLTAYGFQILSFRALSDAQYKALNVLWVIVFVVSPGFFQPLEQEVARAIAHRRARGIGGAPLVKRAAVLGAVLCGLAVVAAAAGYLPLTRRLFHHEVLLFVGLLCALGCYYAAYMVRGTLAGNGRFGPYGMMQGTEGGIRLAATIVLVALAVHSPGPYGFALALPPAAAILVSLRGQHDLLVPGPAAPYSELSSALGFLLLGSLLAQVLSYASFLAVVVLEHPGSDRAGKFVAGLYIARIPILMFQAVQAALLPKLAGLAGAGRADDFRSGLKKLVVIVLGVGLAGTLGGFALGGFAGKVLFGHKFVLGNRDLGLLALGSAAFILALTLAQGLIAIRRYAQAAFSWLVGIVAFVATTAVGRDLFLRAEVGFVVGCLVAAAMMTASLVSRMRGGIPLDALERFAEDIEHETLEI